MIPNPVRKKGVPWPYIIVPDSDEEASCGRPTLITPGQAEIILEIMEDHIEDELLEKFRKLAEN